ncbi:hypothetical protein FB45DRAFT_870439 [Roridomyces roridus]|uniref:Uncharacterized protein n=1 Tax=Roridomyces roridus TaxID=1738132 RepID=A0AAD7BIS5_9AGAR|nr:hypothetical protein FB45DRAFT_870439 [Roridomyces roridus]
MWEVVMVNIARGVRELGRERGHLGAGMEGLIVARLFNGYLYRYIPCPDDISEEIDRLEDEGLSIGYLDDEVALAFVEVLRPERLRTNHESNPQLEARGGSRAYSSCCSTREQNARATRVETTCFRIKRDDSQEKILPHTWIRHQTSSRTRYFLDRNWNALCKFRGSIQAHNEMTEMRRVGKSIVGPSGYVGGVRSSTAQAQSRIFARNRPRESARGPGSALFGGASVIDHSKWRLTLRPTAKAAATGLIKLSYEQGSLGLTNSEHAMLLPILYKHLDPSSIPSAVDLDASPRTDDVAVRVNGAVVTLSGLVRQIGELKPTAAATDLWPRVRAWFEFLHTYRGLFPTLPAFDEVQLPWVVAFLIMFFMEHPDTSAAIHASSGMRTIIATAWSEIVHEGLDSYLIECATYRCAALLAHHLETQPGSAWIGAALDAGLLHWSQPEFLPCLEQLSREVLPRALVFHEVVARMKTLLPEIEKLIAQTPQFHNSVLVGHWLPFTTLAKERISAFDAWKLRGVRSSRFATVFQLSAEISTLLRMQAHHLLLIDQNFSHRRDRGFVHALAQLDFKRLRSRIATQLLRDAAEDSKDEPVVVLDYLGARSASAGLGTWSEVLSPEAKIQWRRAQQSGGRLQVHLLAFADLWEPKVLLFRMPNSAFNTMLRRILGEENLSDKQRRDRLAALAGALEGMHSF